MRSNGKPAVVQAEFDERGNQLDPTGDAALMLHGGATIQRTQTQYSGALTVQKPRERKAIQTAVLEEAGLSGEDFFYSWTTKNRDGTRGLVEGISIEGAMILARNWGNCALPVDLTVDAPTHWVFAATFVDLETGFNGTRLFRQRKTQSTGKMDADRTLDIAFQIGQSKAIRNAIDKAMPSWLTGPALEKAKSSSEGKFRDVVAANKKALAAFGEWGVTSLQLEEKLGLKIEFWTPRDHVSLSGLYRAIRDRQTTIAEEFPPPEAAKPAEVPAAQEKAADPAANAYGSSGTTEATDREAKGA